MVSVRKRGKVYEYRFEIATVEETRKWITKSGYPTKSEAFKEGAKAYNDFYYNGTKTQLKEKMSYADFLDFWSHIIYRVQELQILRTWAEL